VEEFKGYFCRPVNSMNRFWDKWKSWELWPFWMRYFLITPHWLLYCIRSGSLWFFTPSNPTIDFGGFEGEGKREMYEQLPPHSFPNTIYIKPGIPFTQVKEQLTAAGFSFPFIVKPDVGMSGILFRKMEKEEQLKRYHEVMPADYLIQALVDYPVEFSVFYYRFPDQEKGVITGFLQKEPMHVIGDGSSSLLQLIEQHPKARHRQEELQAWHKERLGIIIPDGQKYYLTLAANLNRGGNFINLHTEIDEALHKVFDELNHYSKHFFYGRYDLKATSLDDLKAGKNFLILEYNGSGAEPNHVYNSGYSLRQAHKEILKHWKVLYQISAMNKAKGIKPWSFSKGWQFVQKAKQHFAALEKVDAMV
jgi:hypothetical protein